MVSSHRVLSRPGFLTLWVMNKKNHFLHSLQQCNLLPWEPGGIYISGFLLISPEKLTLHRPCTFSIKMLLAGSAAFIRSFNHCDCVLLCFSKGLNSVFCSLVLNGTYAPERQNTAKFYRKKWKKIALPKSEDFPPKLMLSSWESLQSLKMELAAYLNFT